MNETVHKLQMKSSPNNYPSDETANVILCRFPSLTTNPVLISGLLNFLPDLVARLGEPSDLRTTEDSIWCGCAKSISANSGKVLNRLSTHCCAEFSSVRCCSSGICFASRACFSAKCLAFSVWWLFSRHSEWYLKAWKMLPKIPMTRKASIKSEPEL